MTEAGYPPTAKGWQRFKGEHEVAGTWGHVRRLHDQMKADGVADFTARFAEMLKKYPTDGLEPRFRKRDDYVSSPHPVEKKVGSSVVRPKKHKRVSDVEVMRWVFENIGNGGISTEDAPSRGAWELLKDCESDPKIRQELRSKWFQNVMKKEDSQVSDEDVQHEKRLDSRLLEFERAE